MATNACIAVTNMTRADSKFAYYQSNKTYAAATLSTKKATRNVSSPHTDTIIYTSLITPDELAEIASIRALVSQYQVDLDQKDREYQAALAEEHKQHEVEQEQAQQQHAELSRQIEQLMALLGIPANPQVATKSSRAR